MGIGCNRQKDKWHIYIIGTSSVKIFLTEENSFTEDINLRAESDDFQFVYEILANLLSEEKTRDEIEACLLF